MSFSDITPENLTAAALAFDASQDSPIPHHVSVMLKGAALRITELEQGWVPVSYREAIESAHMAGQSDAGVDPSYSNAQAYFSALPTPPIEGK